MERSNVVALVIYLQRAHAIIPTTGAEYEAMRVATQTLEAVANGLLTLEVKPVEAKPATQSPPL